MTAGGSQSAAQATISLTTAARTAFRGHQARMASTRHHVRPMHGAHACGPRAGPMHIARACACARTLPAAARMQNCALTPLKPLCSSPSRHQGAMHACHDAAAQHGPQDASEPARRAAVGPQWGEAEERGGPDGSSAASACATQRGL
jgi:hypothetical protein